MKAPKLLPWIARKAGISDELALKLWRRAAGEAEEHTGVSQGSDYYALAIGRFLDLVEGEATRNIDRDTSPNAESIGTRTGWMWRYQNRMSLLGMIATQSSYQLWQNTWHNATAPRRSC